MTSSTRQRHLLPILQALADYQPEWLRFDVIAGLTTAAVVIPKAMAYATIAGCRCRWASTRPSCPC